MSKIIGNMLSYTDRVQVESLNQRLTRNNVVSANIANSETPGYRAVGFGFENQLQELLEANKDVGVKTSNPRHLKSVHTSADGSMNAEVFVRPSETIPEDGNTVDIDKEMAVLSKNQILYRSAVELLNRKLGTLRYAISGGGR